MGMNDSTVVPALLAALAFGTAGCTSSLSGPADLDEVSIEVHVTGGLAGIDERIEISGRDRVVETTCSGACSSGDEVALALTGLQWQDLVDEVFGSGLPQMGERDFGTECCDFFEVEITYDDGDHRAVVAGDANTLPDRLAALARRLMALREATVPALVRPGAVPGSGPSSPLQIDSLWQSGHRLEVALHYSGGCEAHGIDLLFDAEWRESFPVQTTAWLTHHDPGDMCDALPHEVRGFDLTRFFETYRASYPGSAAGTPISVGISAPGDSTVHTIEVLLP